jgi:hypothetical protein
MEARRFDSFVRLITEEQVSRRGALRRLAGGALAAGLARPGLEQAAAKACKNDNDCPRRDERCCDRKCIDVSNNEKHCGKCGRQCGEGEKCKGGRCKGGTCPPEAPVVCRQQLDNPKSRCCTENSPVCCQRGSFASCCPESAPNCCPPRDQGFNVPCCPPERPNCCAGPGGCCADGFECTPEGCVLIIPPR